ncbi:hypothetical protein [Mycoplasmopsis cricetuli]|uniref:hypothetical protein n=1 Tax=Mycoplasmopsis cricetuli TaxID=171283 RepID=UPI0004711278|nr:hypothetical protein [Mycoplasmopsis cricetuli]
MKNYKNKIIIWSIITVISSIMIIVLSVLIAQLSQTISLFNTVTLDLKILETYNYVKAYSIGGLAFFCILFVMGSIISYAGIRSWKYSELFN